METVTQNELERTITALNDYATVKRELEELRTGKAVVIPIDMEHAKFMLMIAQGYISRRHEETMNAIKGD